MFAVYIRTWPLATPGRATQQLRRRCHCMKMCSTPAVQVPSLMSAFEELGICPEIIQAVEEVQHHTYCLSERAQAAEAHLLSASVVAR